MKIRRGHVTNSSSSSYVVLVNKANQRCISYQAFIDFIDHMSCRDCEFEIFYSSLDGAERDLEELRKSVSAITNEWDKTVGEGAIINLQNVIEHAKAHNLELASFRTKDGSIAEEIIHQLKVDGVFEIADEQQSI